MLFGFLFLIGGAVAGLFPVQTHTLKNGLQIIVVPNGIVPAVDVSIIYKVGTADDPSDARGISHFLEHMMFKGSSSNYTKDLMNVGAVTNAYTTDDFTAYIASITVDFLEILFKEESKRMSNLTFSDEEIESEKSVVEEERRMRIDNHPYGQVWEYLYRALFPYHPYGVLPIGYDHHIKNYSKKAASDHYKKWYGPNNATMIICGKVTLEEILPLIEKYFGSIRKIEIPNRKRPSDPPKAGISQHIRQSSDKFSVITLELLYPAPHQSSHDPSIIFATIVLEQILGGNETTTFYRHFVEDRKNALAVSAQYEYPTLDPHYFSITATLPENSDIEKFKKELKDYIDSIVEKITQQEVETAKNDIISSFAFMKDGNQGAINHFSAVSCDISIDLLNSVDKHIQNVTTEDVKKAAKMIFSNNPFVTMELLPNKKNIL